MSKRYQLIRKRCAKQTAAVREEMIRIRNSGQYLTLEEHLLLHEKSFRAGAAAMAESIRVEMDAMREQEAEMLNLLEAAGDITRFPFPGTEHRFSSWPTNNGE